MNKYVIDTFENSEEQLNFDLLVLAAGFEERALSFMSSADLSSRTKVVIVGFSNNFEINEEIIKKYLEIAKSKVAEENIFEVKCDTSNPESFRANFTSLIKKMSSDCVDVAVDISGMPSHIIFTVLESIRKSRLYTEQTLIYSSAEKYLPSKEEYDHLVEQQGREIEYLPKSMALEMDENLVFEPFNGYRRNELNSCLFLFAGYEAHRSTGVIDAINPTLTLFVYGNPASPNMDWRTDLSERVHRKFERMLRCAKEYVCTQNVNDSVAILEEYYNYLIDDFDVTIAPLGSKLQTVACFLFWERYPEIRVTFPLPIGYDPAQSPVGFDKTFILKIPSRLGFQKED